MLMIEIVDGLTSFDNVSFTARRLKSSLCME